MSMQFASSQKALGICDVCGFQYKLRELRTTVVKGRVTNIKACKECWDPDHPQLKLGEFPVHDPQALRDPRPDAAERVASRDIQFGWNPVGLNDPFNLADDDLVANGAVGTVTVAITQETDMADKKKPLKPKKVKKPSKNTGIKVRGTGAATKGLYARGPMA